MTINMIPCEAKNPCGGVPEFAKGDGRDVNPNVKYYFLRVPEEIAKKEGFIPEVPEKASENELVNLEVINCIYKTSEVIKNYIDRRLDDRDHGDHGRDYMYFVRLNSNTGDVQLNNIYTYKQDKKEGADPKLIPEFIPKLIPNVDSKHHLEKTMSGEEITRHHIIEADQYLKEIHGKVIPKIHGKGIRNHDHVILDGNKPWASGNLVLGPPPEMNYHDGTKSVQNKGKGFVKPRKRQIHDILGYDSDLEEQIEVWMLREKMKLSPKIKPNIECIKLCFQYLKKPDAEKFQKEWSKLEKLPMMVGVWSPADYNQIRKEPGVKWKCTALLSRDQDIVSSLALLHKS